MDKKFRLFTTVAQTSALAVAAYFAVDLALAPRMLGPDVPRGVQATAAAIIVFLPIGATSWWLFRRLQNQYTSRESRNVAIAFAVFTPISLLISGPLAVIPGAYAGFLGRPFGLVGAVVVMVAITSLLSFVASALALWITRWIKSVREPQ
jgi:hypothetical protein